MTDEKSKDLDIAELHKEIIRIYTENESPGNLLAAVKYYQMKTGSLLRESHDAVKKIVGASF